MGRQCPTQLLLPRVTHQSTSPSVKTFFPKVCSDTLLMALRWESAGRRRRLLLEQELRPLNSSTKESQGSTVAVLHTCSACVSPSTRACMYESTCAHITHTYIPHHTHIYHITHMPHTFPRYTHHTTYTHPIYKNIHTLILHHTTHTCVYITYTRPHA